MNTWKGFQQASGLSACGIATALLGFSLAVAKFHDIATESSARAVKTSPAYEAVIAMDEEHWVRVTLLVDSEGRSIDVPAAH